MMRTILLIGIGVGDPDQLTMQAVKALNRADVVFIPSKGTEKASLRAFRETIIERYADNPSARMVAFDVPGRAPTFDDYKSNVDDWHAAIAHRYADLFRTELPDGAIGAFLIWGDPCLYDSAMRIIERVRATGMALAHEVIPGITSIQVLAARHRIALNTIGEPFIVTTGRKLEEGFPEGADTAIVLLDGQQTFKTLANEDLDIFWGAYLGTEQEILIAGPLAEVADTIDAARAEARHRHGWIMDTYLLRRR